MDLEFHGTAGNKRTENLKHISSKPYLPSNSSEIETYSTTACQPWTEIRVKTQINLHPKVEEAKAHEAKYKILKQDNHNIVCYTDGSMLNEHIGAGNIVEMTAEAVIEATYQIDHQ
jgi:hypothetical protein